MEYTIGPNWMPKCWLKSGSGGMVRFICGSSFHNNVVMINARVISHPITVRIFRGSRSAVNNLRRAWKKSERKKKMNESSRIWKRTRVGVPSSIATEVKEVVAAHIQRSAK